MRNYNFDNIYSFLDQFTWNFYYSLTDPEDIWFKLYSAYINGLNLVAPFVEMNCREKDSWVSSALLDLIRERDMYKVKAETSPDNNDFEEFKKLRNKCQRTTSYFFACKDFEGDTEITKWETIQEDEVFIEKF